jgi:hypothetical protein
VHRWWHDALFRARHLGVDAQLEHVLRLGGTRELRIGDVVGVVAERRLRVGALQQEVRIAVSAADVERPLIDDVRTVAHRRAGCLDPLRQSAFRCYLDDGPPSGTQELKKAALLSSGAKVVRATRFATSRFLECRHSMKFTRSLAEKIAPS